MTSINVLFTISDRTSSREKIMRIIKMIPNGQMFYLLSNSFNYASVQMDLIKNLQLRQSVAKLRSGNHVLRIKTGRLTVSQKFLKTLEYVNTVP